MRARRVGGARWASSKSGEAEGKAEGGKQGDGGKRDEEGVGAGGGGFFATLRKSIEEEIEKNDELKKAWGEAFGRRGEKGGGGAASGAGAGGDKNSAGAAAGEGGEAAGSKAGSERRGRAVKEQAGAFAEKAKEGAGTVGSAAREKLQWLTSRLSSASSTIKDRTTSAADKAKDAAGRVRKGAAESEFVKETQDAARKAAEEVEEATGAFSRVRQAIDGTHGHLKRTGTLDKWREAWQDLFATTEVTVRRQHEKKQQRKVDMKWQEHVDEKTGYLYYHNPELGVTQWEQPECWEQVQLIRSQLAHVRARNEKQSRDAADSKHEGPDALMVVKGAKSAWEQFGERLRSTPIIQEILGASEEAARTLRSSSVGRMGQQARSRLSDKAEDLREKWETSQSPLVYTVSSLMDTVTAETEMAKCVGETRRLDPVFDMYHFQKEVEINIIPEVLAAFLEDKPIVLRRLCSGGAFAQVRASIADRRQLGLVFDPHILDIKDVELSAAKLIEGDPMYVFRCTANQINCVRDREGNVVDGREDDVREVYYAFALQREYNEETAELEWKVAEFSVLFSQPTL